MSLALKFHPNLRTAKQADKQTERSHYPVTLYGLTITICYHLCCSPCK